MLLRQLSTMSHAFSIIILFPSYFSSALLNLYASHILEVTNSECSHTGLGDQVKAVKPELRRNPW